MKYSKVIRKSDFWKNVAYGFVIVLIIASAWWYMDTYIWKGNEEPKQTEFDACAEIPNVIRIDDRCMMYWYFSQEEFNRRVTFGSLVSKGDYQIQNDSFSLCEEIDGKFRCVPEMISYNWNITEIKSFEGLDDPRRILYIYDSKIESSPVYPNCHIKIFSPSSYSYYEYRDMVFDSRYIIAEGVFC